MTRTSSAIARGIVLASVLSAAAAHANIISISGSVGGAPTGVSHVNFDNLSAGQTGNLTGTGPDGSVSLSITPNAQVVVGSGSGYAAPYLSGNNGQGFASQVGPGADTTPYLTTGSTANGLQPSAIRLDFGSTQQYFGLLWGSIDGYNKLEFFNAANQSVGVVTGTDVIANANGDQGVNGTRYVNINVDPFTYVIATSTSYAFEFDNVAYNSTVTYVPDGGWMLGLTGAGMIGLGVLRRRQA